MLKFYKFSLNPCYTIVAPTKGLPYPILEWSIRTWSPFRVTPKNNNGNHITLLEVKEPKTKLRNNKKTKTQSFRERTSSAVMIALICWLKKKKKPHLNQYKPPANHHRKKKLKEKIGNLPPDLERLPFPGLISLRDTTAADRGFEGPSHGSASDAWSRTCPRPRSRSPRYNLAESNSSRRPSSLERLEDPTRQRSRRVPSRKSDSHQQRKNASGKGRSQEEIDQQQQRYSDLEVIWLRAVTLTLTLTLIQIVTRRKGFWTPGFVSAMGKNGMEDSGTVAWLTNAAGKWILSGKSTDHVSIALQLKKKAKESLILGIYFILCGAWVKDGAPPS